MPPPPVPDPAALAQTFAAFARDRRPEQRDELVEAHLPLASHLARRFAHRGIPTEDLVQVAALGLVHAVDRFDPGRGSSFAAFATPTILGEIKRHFRDRAWDLHVPRRVQELYLSLNAAIEELSQRSGRSPTIAELATATRAAEEEVLEAIEAGLAFQAVTIESPGPTSVPEIRRAIALPDLDLDATDDRVLMQEVLATLPPREQLIVRLRYYEGMTQRDIGVRLGISQMHVSRLLRRSLDTLREHPQLLDAVADDASGVDLLDHDG